MFSRAEKRVSAAYVSGLPTHDIDDENKYAKTPMGFHGKVKKKKKVLQNCLLPRAVTDPTKKQKQKRRTGRGSLCVILWYSFFLRGRQGLWVMRELTIVFCRLFLTNTHAIYRVSLEERSVNAMRHWCCVSARR